MSTQGQDSADLTDGEPPDDPARAASAGRGPGTRRWFYQLLPQNLNRSILPIPSRLFRSRDDSSIQDATPLAPRDSVDSDTGFEHELLSVDSEYKGRRTLSEIGRAFWYLFQYIFCSWWKHILLVFAPLGLVTYLTKAHPMLVFTTNAIATIPLSAFMTDATEDIASYAGDFAGAILNISLGNLVELILFIVALAHNQIAVVQASILGSILVNLLLILGLAILTGSVYGCELLHNASETQLLGCLLYVSLFTFLMLTAFDYTFKAVEGADHALLQMNRLSALIVLVIYILYFVHQFKPRPEKSSPHPHELESFQVGRYDRLPDPIHSSPVLAPRTIQFADEDVDDSDAASINSSNLPAKVGAISDYAESDACLENCGASEVRGRRRSNGPPTGGHLRGVSSMSSYPHSLHARKISRSISLSSSRDGLIRSLSFERGEVPEAIGSMSAAPIAYDTAGPRSLTMSIFLLIISSAVLSMCADFLVSTIDDIVRDGGLSESVIGLIILPVVGNVAELITVVTVAANDKMDLAIGVSVGSSIQIALCVAPVTVLAGWALDRDLVLTFNYFEMATLLGSAILVNFIILNGRASGLKGSLMCACYGIICLGSYLSPELAPCGVNR